MKPRSLNPRFLVLENATALRTHEIEPGQELKVGRQAVCEIVIPHPSVSRQHARIYCDASGVHIEDLQTANGTWVNDRRIQERITLRSGDTVRVGQTKEAVPLLLKFEDPSTVLLDALTEDEKPATSSGVISSRLIPAVAGAVSPPESQVPRALSVTPTRQGFFHFFKQPVVWIPLGSAVLAAVAIGIWFVVGTQTTQKSWQSVRVEPLKVQSGWKMTLRGPEITPASNLKILIQGHEARIDSMTPGEIQLTVPELESGELGTRSTVVRVEKKGIILFEQPIQYDVVPQIRNVNPIQAAVGETVSIEGTGFTATPDNVRIQIGQMSAPVISSTPVLIQCRVPVITRNSTVDAQIEVRMSDWSSPPVMMKIRPRDAPCYAMEFTASYIADRVWEIRHPLGTALFVEGPPPSAAGAPRPRNIQQTIQALQTAFQKAQTDPTVRFEVREAGSAPALTALGGSLSGSLEAARWTVASLALAKSRSRFSGESIMIPYWNVMVLNELLNLFGKGQVPSILPSSSGMRIVLQRLHDRNIEVGGMGCPGADDVQTLTVGERDQIQEASWEIPSSFGSVSGRWDGELENIFSSEGENVRHHLRLELNQHGASLSGTALIEEIRPQGIRWSRPTIHGVQGRLILGGDVRVEINLPAVSPFNVIRVAGGVHGDAIDGSFTTQDGRRGKCRFQRTAGG